MTKQQKPKALRLADAIDPFERKNAPDHLTSKVAADELRRLHAENNRLQQELINESHRTAEQKLRADQMTRQHADQAAMNREARAQLATLVDAQQPASPARAHKACKPDMLVNGGALKLALNVLRRAGKNEVADELEATTWPAAEAEVFHNINQGGAT